MSQADEVARAGRYTAIKALLIILAFLGIGIVMWGLLLNDNRQSGENRNNPVPVNTNDTTGSNQPIPQEPANPNVTGGSSGVGTGTSNDNAVQTPSPAGGVDTNQAPQ